MTSPQQMFDDVLHTNYDLTVVRRPLRAPAVTAAPVPADGDDCTWTEEAQPAGLAYDLHTSGDHIAELTAAVDRLNRAHEQLAAQMHELSVELSALRGAQQ
jgi:hypothetical protein